MGGGLCWHSYAVRSTGHLGRRPYPLSTPLSLFRFPDPSDEHPSPPSVPPSTPPPCPSPPTSLSTSHSPCRMEPLVSPPPTHPHPTTPLSPLSALLAPLPPPAPLHAPRTLQPVAAAGPASVTQMLPVAAGTAAVTGRGMVRLPCRASLSCAVYNVEKETGGGAGWASWQRQSRRR